MKFNRLYNIFKNFLAVVGLISIVSIAAAFFFIVKSYNYPPSVIGLKILKKAGLGDSSFAQA